MIQNIMFVVLGFFLAGLLTLLFAGPFWRRAVRLTTKRLEATMPMSVADINADKDQLRAEYAIRVRRLEIAHEREKDNAARFLVERNKHKVTIAELKNEIKAINDQLAERNSASIVLEQTVQKKIPELREQLERARQIIAARDRDLVRMTTAYENQTEALQIAKKAAQRYNAEIERLRVALETGGEPRGRRRVRGGPSDQELAAENKRLQTQVSRLRQQVEEQRHEELAGNALLKAEIHRLAQHMIDGTPPTAEKPKEIKEAAEAKEAKEAPPAKAAANKKGKKKDTAGAPAKKRTRRRTRSRGRKKTGDRLTDRLKKLTAREEA